MDMVILVWLRILRGLNPKRECPVHALGGHRLCHKRSSESVYERNENNADYSTDFRKNAKVSSQYTKKNVNPQKSKGHVCPFCRRVFKNGQALSVVTWKMLIEVL